MSKRKPGNDIDRLIIIVDSEISANSTPRFFAKSEGTLTPLDLPLVRFLDGNAGLVRSKNDKIPFLTDRRTEILEQLRVSLEESYDSELLETLSLAQFPLSVLLNSPGGHRLIADPVKRIIDFIRGNNRETDSYITGTAASAAAQMAIATNTRYALTDSSLLWHTGYDPEAALYGAYLDEDESTLRASEFQAICSELRGLVVGGAQLAKFDGICSIAVKQDVPEIRLDGTLARELGIVTEVFPSSSGLARKFNNDTDLAINTENSNDPASLFFWCSNVSEEIKAEFSALVTVFVRNSTLFFIPPPAYSCPMDTMKSISRRIREFARSKSLTVKVAENIF